mmetsp:Transcript_130783/g.226286  ORF Transcript_130783/g.226286 Transcript_130783/m.226286 type:complete len:104 (+) Transcript_130783:1417-1728(+)
MSQVVAPPTASTTPNRARLPVAWMSPAGWLLPHMVSERNFYPPQPPQTDPIPSQVANPGPAFSPALPPSLTPSATLTPVLHLSEPFGSHPCPSSALEFAFVPI